MSLVYNRFANAIAQIRLANSQCKVNTFVPYSLFNMKILRILKAYGLISTFIVQENDTIEVILNPNGEFSGLRPMKYIFANVKTYNRYNVSFKILEELALENPGSLIILSTQYGLTTFDQLYYNNFRIGGIVHLIITLT